MKKFTKLLFFFVICLLQITSCSKEDSSDVAKKYNPVISVKNEIAENISLNLSLPESIEKNQTVNIKITTETKLPLEILVGYRTAGVVNWKMKSLRFVDDSYQASIPGYYAEGKGIELFFLYSVPGSEKQFFFATSENPSLLAINSSEKEKVVTKHNVKIIKKVINIKEKPSQYAKLAQEIFNTTEKENAEPATIPQQEPKKNVLAMKEPVSTSNIKDKRNDFSSIKDIAVKDKLEVPNERDKTLNDIKSLGFSFDADGFVGAAFSGKIEAIKLFLKAGFNPNMSNTKMNYAIIAAANRDSVDIIELLIKSGANVNVRDSKGYTPLLKAVYRKNIRSVKVLVKNGADINIKNQEDVSPLLYANQNNNDELLRIFNVVPPTPKVQPKAVATPAAVAAPAPAKVVAAQPSAPVKAVAQLPAPVKPPVQSPKEKALAELLAKGIKADAESFVNVARDNKADIVKLMISAGINPNSKNSEGRPAIVAAANRGSLQAVEILIKSGADINLGDKKGDTAIMKATYRSELAVIAILVRHGADIDLKNNEGSSAYLYAEKKGLDKVLEVLTKKKK